jgi:formylglycine-generating enzyme required for sulfatase activity
MQIDDRIKQAQRKGAGLYVLGALATAIVIISVLSWLFLVRGFVLIIGPSDATNIASVTKVSGMALVSDNKVYTLGGAVEVSVRADTFEENRVIITAESPSNIEVTLQPSPAILKATLSVPGETSWYLNNELIFVGNTLYYAIPAGNYELVAQNPYFQPWQILIDAQRAQTIPLTVEFEPVRGNLSLNTVPTGAEIFLDGQSIGLSPLSIELIGGEYEVTTKLGGYQDIQDTLQLSFTRAQLERNYRLIPEQATISFSASPAGGVLLINNIEKSLNADSLKVYSLDANTRHRIVYSKPGCFSYDSAMTFAPGETRTLKIALKPELGKVSVSSNVIAQVSINGQSRGATPFSADLAAKETQVTLEKPGYRAVTRSFTPSSKNSTNLNIPLLTEFDARRQEGRPLFANQMGIHLLRFNGDAYEMGSAPNEEGRRRNEHQLNVDFSRSFWVSQHEITQAQYAAFNGQSSNSKLPQTDISWDDAARFTNWLSEQEGLPVFYRIVANRVVGFDANSRGYRLPTEAEWEWLAKKVKRPRSTIYVWGNQTRIPSNSGNFADESSKANQLIFLEDYDDKQMGVAPVGSFTADRAGLYDLAGNVSEWVHDFYTTALPDDSKVHIDYLGAARGTQHVVKGANYSSGRLRELRAAFREVGETPKPTIGFRIARYDQ